MNRAINRIRKYLSDSTVILNILEYHIRDTNWAIRNRIWEWDEEAETHSELERQRSALVHEYNRRRAGVEQAKKSLAYYHAARLRNKQIKELSS